MNISRRSLLTISSGRFGQNNIRFLHFLVAGFLIKTGRMTLTSLSL